MRQGFELCNPPTTLMGLHCERVAAALMAGLSSHPSHWAAVRRCKPQLRDGAQGAKQIL